MSRDTQAPETLEGWYAFHQVVAIDRAAVGAMAPAEFDRVVSEFVAAWTELCAGAAGEGWSSVVPLVGSRADVMLIHLRATLDGIGTAQQSVVATSLMRCLRPVYTFLSVTEAGLYHLTAQLARESVARGGSVGDDQYNADLKAKVEAERATDHVKRRLYPQFPGVDLPYVCFYPMDKKREAGQNWYALTLDERSELMRAHGTTGRKYAGRVLQIITGAIGLDAWEWGVTLFARDPLDFKKLVTEMRFDEVSARYADFGEFFVGKVATAAGWLSELRDYAGRRPGIGDPPAAL